MFKKFGVALALILFAGLTSQVNAAVLSSFSDDFEAETKELNSNDFLNWNVSNGTVDTIGTGFYDLCDTNTCVDLDGSTRNAGDLSTKDSFAIGTYKLSFRIAGNQRGGSSDGVNVTFGDLNEDFSKNPGDAFEEIIRIVTLTTEGILTFSHAGGDNIGILLDDVEISAVPLPAALPLYAAGMALLGFMGWRKRKASA
ncbi:VPLPA-CTERM sorting domain-containing protein [Sneathiella limimaris]|uniref:VPLPA-CTERM sorting domain-containing protein n=1 Tax=Sneathiella limimaris TaxID=1964213 RepID=UPI00146AFAC7|nr:VPLPA-CTERM sorting domain-containing protein [Sneathiella limimaris]